MNLQREIPGHASAAVIMVPRRTAASPEVLYAASSSASFSALSSLLVDSPTEAASVQLLLRSSCPAAFTELAAEVAGLPTALTALEPLVDLHLHVAGESEADGSGLESAQERAVNWALGALLDRGWPAAAGAAQLARLASELVVPLSVAADLYLRALMNRLRAESS